MTDAALSSKTLSRHDLEHPGVAVWARHIRRLAFRLGLEGTPFAVNGILRHRFTVRRHKLWEYARGAAGAFACSGGAPQRVLDFGGGATLPVFFFASRGIEVLCLDVDVALTEWTNRVAAARQWPLRGSTYDLVAASPPPDWQPFDAVVSSSVLEHIPKPAQPRVMERLAALLRPGGVMAISFDFGADAPQPGAIRDAAEVERLVAATRLAYLDGRAFQDTGERFALDRRHPRARFTFGSLILRK
jgi:2-polyprenyl-3-methyl-5-hydroxy-6-metoxy-1,4-benzoquinol methylase